jgi:hypothetical protein
MTEDSGTDAAWLVAEATRWVDLDGFPYVVEVVFVDADGERHSIVDKTPLFWYDDDQEPDLDTRLPVPAYLDAVVLESDLPGDRVRIGIDHRSVNDEGYGEFVVSADQLT